MPESLASRPQGFLSLRGGGVTGESRERGNAAAENFLRPLLRHKKEPLRDHFLAAGYLCVWKRGGDVRRVPEGISASAKGHLSYAGRFVAASPVAANFSERTGTMGSDSRLLNTWTELMPGLGERCAERDRFVADGV
jgi:hypothetical protein